MFLTLYHVPPEFRKHRYVNEQFESLIPTIPFTVHLDLICIVWCLKWCKNCGLVLASDGCLLDYSLTAHYKLDSCPAISQTDVPSASVFIKYT
jgi:hypothetical protein